MKPRLPRPGRADALAGILLAYLVLCAAMLPGFLHRVAPDASCYLTIARKYHAGDFVNAINGYWSPLLSWLVAPFLGLGLPAEVVATCVQVALGAGALAAVWRLGTRLELPDAVRGWSTLCLVPAVAMYALADTTPDLLVAVILVGYVGIVIGTDYPRSIWQGAACGLLGALAYLAKAYAFPFFLAHFLAVSGYLFLRRRSSGDAVRRLAAATAMGLLVFAVVAGGWAGLISRKYSRLTIGTTGSYQFSLFQGGGGGLFAAGGLFPPPNATAISAWEDPTDLRTTVKPAAKNAVRSPAADPVDWAPEGAAKGQWPRPRDVAGRVGRNLVQLLWTLVRFCWVSPLILLGLALSCRRMPSGPGRDRHVILLGTLLLYPSGYLLIFIQQRYLWLMAFLLSVAAGLLVTSLPGLKRSPWRTAWPIVAAISFTLWPVWVTVRLWHNVLEATPAVAAHLRTTIPPGARIASDREWGITNSIAYYLDARYYGMLPPGASPDEQKRQVREHRIEYFVVWADPGRYPMLASAREVPMELAEDSRLGRPPRVFEVPSRLREPGSPVPTPGDRP